MQFNINIIQISNYSHKCIKIKTKIKWKKIKYHNAKVKILSSIKRMIIKTCLKTHTKKSIPYRNTSHKYQGKMTEEYDFSKNANIRYFKSNQTQWYD